MTATTEDDDDGDGATGDEVEDDGDGAMGNGTTGYDDNTMMTERRATKLTMMSTTMTMATGNDNNDVDGAMGDDVTGYDDDDDGDGRR